MILRPRLIFFFFWSWMFCASPLFSQDFAKKEGETPGVQLNKKELIEVEDLSESLANALLDFSAAVRDRNADVMARYFQDSLEMTPIQLDQWKTHSLVNWIQQSEWAVPPARTVTGKEALEFFKEWLDRFSEIEDARFKVKEALFDSSVRAESGIKFFLVGRDAAGRRLWFKGTGHLKARRNSPEDHWRLSLLALDHVSGLKASRELFSEVSAPSGLALGLPAYGTPGNDDFVYHGAAAADFNGDGWMDVVATGLLGPWVYLNQGDGTFQEVAQKAGILPHPRTTAALAVDYDNDGDQDLFLSAVGEQMLFENRLIPDGKLLFLDTSLEAGVALPAIGFSAVAGDVNQDGWPDIYVNSYNRYGVVMPNAWHKATNGTPNLLFVNQKDGRFKEAAKEWGVADSRWSYAAMFSDVNGDGRQDLYVANDFGENALYVNQGGRFEDRASESGVLDPGNGMGVSFGDYNNDGVLDLYVTNMSSTAGNRILHRLFPQSTVQNNVLVKLAAGNNLYRGSPDGVFTDVTEQAGPFSAGWAWGGVFMDLDNDGWQDLFSTNGFISGKSMHDT